MNRCVATNLPAAGRGDGSTTFVDSPAFPVGTRRRPAERTPLDERPGPPPRTPGSVPQPRAATVRRFRHHRASGTALSQGRGTASAAGALDPTGAAGEVFDQGCPRDRLGSARRAGDELPELDVA